MWRAAVSRDCLPAPCQGLGGWGGEGRGAPQEDAYAAPRGEKEWLWLGMEIGAMLVGMENLRQSRSAVVEVLCNA